MTGGAGIRAAGCTCPTAVLVWHKRWMHQMTVCSDVQDANETMKI